MEQTTSKADRISIMKLIPPQYRSYFSYLWRAVGLILVLSLTISIALSPEQVRRLQALGYAGAFLAMLASNATVILPAPGLVIVFALGSSLNPLLVGLCAAVGATLGEITGYITGYSGMVVMENTRIAQRIQSWMKRNGPLTIFVLSIVPNPFFDIAGILAGASKMPLWKFQSFTFGGKLIQSILIALAGSLSLHWIEPWLSH